MVFIVRASRKTLAARPGPLRSVGVRLQVAPVSAEMAAGRGRVDR